MAKRPPLPEETQPVDLTLPTMNLNECYLAAIQVSENLAIKGVAVEKSWATFLQASSQALGDVNFEVNETFQEPQNPTAASSGVGDTFVRDERRERKFTYSQPLFQGFKAMGALVGAGSLRNQRLDEYERAKQLLFLEVAVAFYSVLMQSTELKIQNETLTLLEERVADLEKRESIGKSRPGEVASAKSRLQALRSAIAATTGDLAGQKRLLEFLTGMSMEHRDLNDPVSLSITPEPLSAYLEDASTRKDVEAAKHTAETFKQAVVIAQSKLWPTITLDANTYEKREGFQSGIDWDVLLNMKIPLFQGGGAIGDLKAAWSDWRQSKLLYRQTLRRAELEIKQAYESLLSSQAQFQALEEAVRTSEENYKLQKQDYGLNLVNNLDVLSALQVLNETKQEANRVLYRLKADYWRLQVARGNCCESA